MGYRPPRKEEKESEIAGVLLSIFPIEGESMGPKGSRSSTRPGEVNRMFENILDCPSVARESKLAEEKVNVDKKKLPDDVKYNEEWWKWYCQENNLDVTTGKSLVRYPMPANYPLF